MAMPQLDFWFDFGSTYSYPAAMLIEDAAAARGVVVAWKPFLLGPIFATHGLATSPFAASSVKGAYMWRDLARVAAKHRLPFRRPPEFPQNGLLAARVALVLDEGARPAFARAVFHAEFGEGGLIGSEEAVLRVLRSLGHDAEGVMAAAQVADNKLALRRQTEDAAARGIFGAPSFVTEDGELFWGHDRMEDALDWAVRVSASS